VPLQTLQGHTDAVRALALSADGQRLYSGSWDSTVRVWSTADGAPLQTLQGHAGCVSALALSADGQRLYSGASDTTVRVW
jgi:WD40 repeat protein